MKILCLGFILKNGSYFFKFPADGVKAKLLMTVVALGPNVFEETNQLLAKFWPHCSKLGQLQIIFVALPDL
jgi:hypothetical protein